MEMYKVKVTNVSKKYHSQTILDQINLQIKEGKVTAILGHNGCGKSTLLRILCGLTNPDKGEVSYAKENKIAYVPEHFPRLPITVLKYLIQMGQLEGMEKETLLERIYELAELFFITDLLQLPIKELSKGTIQKVAIMQALLQVPDILVLDEPFEGQDADSLSNFVSLLKEYKGRVTMVLSCHEEHLVEELADEIFVIKNHRISVPKRRTGEKDEE